MRQSLGGRTTGIRAARTHESSETSDIGLGAAAGAGPAGSYREFAFRYPRFQVRKKIFATLPKDHQLVVLKTTPANLDALMRSDPATFSDEWRGRWLGIRLDRVSSPMFQELLVESYRLAAPKRLAATLKAAGV